ncbi:MAG: glycosyltransferase family protein, partial [Patescibacteria group bacterium]
VIANAGFTLISEALFLRKPYLAWPVAGQFEQILNACFIDKAGYGLHADELNEENIKKFLSNLKEYQQKIKYYKKEDNRKLFAKLDQLIRQYAR